MYQGSFIKIYIYHVSHTHIHQVPVSYTFLKKYLTEKWCVHIFYKDMCVCVCVCVYYLFLYTHTHTDYCLITDTQ